ncbi:MAG: PilZ domain-containing protein [Terriglobales bacterium]
MPNSQNPTERRSQKRARIEVPVKVRTKAGDEPEQSALTRDLSSSGIFLYSESGFEPGAKIELVVMLPDGFGLGPGGWTLCQASVVRVEKSGGKGVGVAATIDRIDQLPEIS